MKVILNGNLETCETFEVEDTNSEQIFSLSNSDDKECETIKLLFESAYDTFGRIIVYDL